MGADPIAAIGTLAGANDHVHAEDTRIENRAAVGSRLETIPTTGPTSAPGTTSRSAPGTTTSSPFWPRFVDVLRAAGYDGPLWIENEDYTLGQRESVALAVDTLRRALTTAGATR